MSNLINVAAFQIGWFACIFSASNHMPWAATFASLAVVALHLYRVHEPRSEIKLLAAAALIGAAWENSLALGGLTGFHDGVLFEGSAPLWMVAQWMMFATTLNQSLAWLKARLALAATLAAIGSPLSYLAGERFGAIILLDRDAALIALAVGWAVLAPLLLVLARRWNGSKEAAERVPEEVRHA